MRSVHEGALAVNIGSIAKKLPVPLKPFGAAVQSVRRGAWSVKYTMRLSFCCGVWVLPLLYITKVWPLLCQC